MTLPLTYHVTFGVLVMVGAMSPGPAFAIVVRRAALSGRGPGMAAAAGIAVGVAAWVVAAATGVAALLAASATAFTVIKVAGAAYLLYLGARALRAALRKGGPLDLGLPGRPDRGPWAAFAEGLLTNTLNPKAALFFMVLVPQFVDEDAALGETLLLAAAALAGTMVWFLLVANVVGTLRRVVARSGVRRAVHGLTGAGLIALGVSLAVTGRP
ncbi:LysE family translocator [Actinomadura sp. ATCC 39365]